MGILNVTPDSFADGGRHDTYEKAVARGLETGSYTQLTLPTNREVEISVVAVELKKKKNINNTRTHRRIKHRLMKS